MARESRSVEVQQQRHLQHLQHQQPQRQLLPSQLLQSQVRPDATLGLLPIIARRIQAQPHIWHHIENSSNPLLPAAAGSDSDSDDDEDLDLFGEMTEEEKAAKAKKDEVRVAAVFCKHSITVSWRRQQCTEASLHCRSLLLPRSVVRKRLSSPSL